MATAASLRRRVLAVAHHQRAIKKRAPYAARTGGKRCQYQRFPQTFGAARKWLDYEDKLSDTEFRQRFKVTKVSLLRVENERAHGLLTPHPNPNSNLLSG